MSLNPNNSMVLLPPAAFQPGSTYSLNSDRENRSFSVYEQLEQLQIEAGRLRIDNEALKTSGRDLLERAPPLIHIPRSSNLVQETLEDIIRKQGTEIDRLRHELEREKSRCLIAINELEQTLHSKEMNWKSQLDELEIRSSELQKVRKEKLYYEQLLLSQQSSKPNEDLHKKLSQQLEQKEKENAALTEEMRLLNLRLTSMNDVMSLQEEKLEQSQGNNQEKRQALLNCWRTKVYDLLMQLKTMELVLKNNSSKFSTDIEQLQNKVGELLQENKILQSQYDDRKNQIQYLQSKLNQSDSSLNRVVGENENLRERLENFEQTEKTVREMLKNFSTNGPYDERIKTINRTMGIYEQRMNFINKRFLVLQTLFNRQILSLSTKKHRAIDVQTDDEFQLDRVTIERELENVTRERDLLHLRLEQESQISRKKTEQLETEFRQENFNVRQELESIKSKLDENQTKIYAYEITIGEKETELKSLKDLLITEQKQKTENLELLRKESQDREEKLLDERDQLEKQLNEAKREQAKFAANFRQIERTSTRDKERWQRQIAEAQNQSEVEIEKLKKRILTLERERNLLMKTIQQEKTSFLSRNVSNDDGDVQQLMSQIRQLASQALDDSSDEETLENLSSRN